MPVASIGKAMTAAACCASTTPADSTWTPRSTTTCPGCPWRPCPGRSCGICWPTPPGSSAAWKARRRPPWRRWPSSTPPGWPLGERASYLNVGYAVLGLVLERGRRLLLRRGHPAPRARPVRHDRPEAVTTAAAQARAATGHLELGGALVSAPWVPTTAGSGATLCTAADLGRLLRAVVAGDPPLLEPGTREAMLTPAIPLPRGPELVRPRRRARHRGRLPAGRPPGRLSRLPQLRLRLPGDGDRRGRPGQRASAAAPGPGRRRGGGRPRPCPAAGGGPGPRPATRPAGGSP